MKIKELIIASTFLASQVVFMGCASEGLRWKTRKMMQQLRTIWPRMLRTKLQMKLAKNNSEQTNSVGGQSPPTFFCLEVSEGICELRLLARLNRRTYCGKSTPQLHRYHNLIHARQPTPPPSTAQPFWLFPVHFSKPALKPFVPQKLVNSHEEGGLTACLA